MEILNSNIQTIIEYLPRVLSAVLTLFVFYFMGKYVSRIFISLLNRLSVDDSREVFLKTIINSIFLYIGLIISLNILGFQRLSLSLLAGGGVTAIVLGFAFREIGENLLAGIFLAFSRPFKIGDLIQSEDVIGHVKKIELRYTHIRASDGSDVFVPSSQLFSKTVTNFTVDGFRRMSFTIGIDYADDTLKACEILNNCFAGIKGILTEPKPNVRISAFKEQFVELQVFYWVDYFNKDLSLLNIQNRIMDSSRRALLDNKFTLSSETTSNIAVKHIE